MKIVSRVCESKGCGRPHKGLGFCGAHYARYMRDPLRDRKKVLNWILLPPQQDYSGSKNRTLLCQVTGCGKPYESKGYCTTHRNIQRRFNVTDEFMRRLLETPCEICGDVGSPHVDHDHNCCPRKGESCGECVRGVLCSHCNTGLGLLKDSPEVLQKAARYLTGKTRESDLVLE